MKKDTMNKKILLTGLMLITCSLLQGQYWDESWSKGYKNTIKVLFEDTAKAKIITWDKVYQTNDLAQTWTELKAITGTGFPRFNDASKSSKDHYRLCDNKGKVWVTNDNFATWNSYSTGNGAFNAINFPSDVSGFALKSGRLFSSINSGQTWASKTEPNGDKIGGMLFLSATTGFVHLADDIRTDTILYRTINGGSSWTPILYPGFQDSTDNSWPSVTVFESKGNRIVIGYEDGKLLKSEDAGITWGFIKTPTSKDVLAVDFYDANLGLIGFEDGHTLETKDGGKTFNGMDCKNAINGFASLNILKPNKYFQIAPGNRHCVYQGRSQPNFDEWEVIQEGTVDRFEGVKYAAKEVLYSYSANQVWRSTDNGSTWNNTAYGFNNYLTTFMSPADANTCFFAHKKWRSGAVIKKVSGGLAQVSDITIPNTDTMGAPTMIKFMTPQKGYFSFQDDATGNSTVYQTLDGGANWSKLSLSLPFATANNDTLCFVDDIQFFDTTQTKGVMIGKGKIGFQFIGWVGFTNDGGSTWVYELKFGLGQNSPFHGTRSLRGDTFGVVAGQNSYIIWSGGHGGRASKLPMVFSSEKVVHNRTSTDDGTGNVNNDPFTHHAIPSIAFPEAKSMDVHTGKDTNWIVGVGHGGLIYRMYYYGTGEMPWQVAGSNSSATGGGTAPAAPSGAALVNVVSSDHVVNITWKDNSTDEDGFKLYRSADGINFNVVQTLLADQVNVNDSFLDEQANYYYKLTSYNSNGESAFSNTVQITTLTHVKTQQKMAIGFYPNPVDNQLHIIGEVNMVRVLNLQGQVILESQSKDVDVSYLKKGVYLIELNSGNQIITMRMVK